MFLANVFNTELPGLMERIFGGGGATTVAATTPAASPTTATAPTAPVATLPPPSAFPGTHNINVTLSNGMTISLTNYPTDVGESLETAGALGTTERLLASLDDIIAALQADPTVDANTVNLLTQLSNQGHDIGQNLSMVESTVTEIETYGLMGYTAGNSTLNLLNSLLPGSNSGTSALVGFDYYQSINGGASNRQITGIITDGSCSSGAVCYSVTMTDLNGNQVQGQMPAGSAHTDFLTTYQQLVQSNAINDPTVAAIVDHLVTDISTTSFSFARAVNEELGQLYFLPSVPPGYVTMGQINNMASTTVHQDSNGICTIGGGTTTAVSCN
jgi:hypothetical protein